MIGVVLWSDSLRQKAVIWCEDNGALAYLRDRGDVDGARWPESGDIVAFEPETDGELRIARQVQQMPGHCDLRTRLATNAPARPVRLTVVPGGAAQPSQDVPLRDLRERAVG
ncbi:hypothetical protein [Paracoccus luteus]|uniref:hypothetical protein n=1 Tax=Paracoccus luteus TaxID=2508543 RepID=UPI00106F4A5C|nr:hypothetical protein [Paracoccus luteus]